MKLSARNQIKGKVVAVTKGQPPGMCASISVAA
jgi:molybdopterin-binding protein